VGFQKREAPHFYAQAEVVVDPVLARMAALREQEGAARITMTVALVRASVAALEQLYLGSALEDERPGSRLLWKLAASVSIAAAAAGTWLWLR